MSLVITVRLQVVLKYKVHRYNLEPLLQQDVQMDPSL